MAYIPLAGNARVGRGVVRSEFIFDKAPFQSCHASTIAETKDGLVAAWFGGTAEGKPDVGIWVSRQGGGHWDAPVEVADGRQADGTHWPCWNPVLFQPRTGPLLLFYKVGPAPWTDWWGVLIESSDGGKTWSAPRHLPEGILGPTQTHLQAVGRTKQKRVFTIDSEDGGHTWGQ